MKRSTHIRPYIYCETIGEKLFQNSALADRMVKYLKGIQVVRDRVRTDVCYRPAFLAWIDKDREIKISKRNKQVREMKTKLGKE